MRALDAAAAPAPGPGGPPARGGAAGHRRTGHGADAGHRRSGHGADAGHRRTGHGADAGRSWRLDDGGRVVTFAHRRDVSVFGDTRSACLSPVHAHPAWTLFLPVDGASVTVDTGDGSAVHHEGVVLAPRQPYRVETDGPHVAVYLAAWATGPTSPRRRTLDGSATHRLLDALQIEGGVDGDAALHELGRLLGPLRAVDARLAAALDGLPDAPRIDALASEVGLSPSRLRALTIAAVGIPLAHLRLWARLLRALAVLPDAPAASAAVAAGFADQPHLTRVARRFLGRTPGTLALRRDAGPRPTG